MTDQIILNLPDDIATRAREIAASTSQPLEQVLIDHLKTLMLPQDEQAELDALHHLSDDALWTIAREQMPDDVQKRAHELMDKKMLSESEASELEKLVQRADQLMLRKAEAATILQERGYPFKQEDFKPLKRD